MLCIQTEQSGNDVCNKLEKRGIKIRGGHELQDVGESWIRVSVRSREDNDCLIGELQKILR